MVYNVTFNMRQVHVSKRLPRHILKKKPDLFMLTMLFLWLSLWFWSKMEAISLPFFLMDRRAFLLS